MNSFIVRNIHMSLGASFSNLENDLITIIKVSFNVFEKVVSDQIVKTKADNLTLVLLRNLQMSGKKKYQKKKMNKKLKRHETKYRKKKMSKKL